MNVSRAHQAILGAAAGLSVVASVVGCVGVPAYVCHSNADCISKDGEQGICGDAVLFSGGEGSNQIWPRGPGPDKFCSFADPSCPSSGRRYAEGAGSLTHAADN